MMVEILLPMFLAQSTKSELHPKHRTLYLKARLSLP